VLTCQHQIDISPVELWSECGVTKGWGFDTPACRNDPGNRISGLLEVPTEHLWHRIGTALRRADLLPTRIIGIQDG
jgi:hypothetical protein